MIFYKVCVRDKRTLWSSDACEEFCLRYRIGQKTVPAPGTKWLMAFRSERLAYAYSCVHTDRVVLECEGEELGKCSRRMSAFPNSFDIKAFWRGELAGRDVRMDESPDVVFLKWCKPLRIVSQQVEWACLQPADPLICLSKV